MTYIVCHCDDKHIVKTTDILSCKIEGLPEEEAVWHKDTGLHCREKNCQGAKQRRSKAPFLEKVSALISTDPYTRNIQDQVELIRDDDDWRENYMTIEMKMDQKYEQGKYEGMKIGKTEGEQYRDKVLIFKWLEKGKTVKEIAEDLDKSEDYVKSFM